MAKLGVRLGYEHQQVVTMLQLKFGYTESEAEELTTRLEHGEMD